MSNDLQADITTHLKGNGLTAATQGVDKLQGAIKRVHGSSHDLQSKAGEVFGRFGDVIEGVEHRLHRVSRAIGRLGGESIAGPLHKLLAVGGLASGFGMLGLAVAGAGIGISLLTEHMEKNAEAAKEEAKAVAELAKAQEEAKKAADEHALSLAKGGNSSFKLLNARGGQAALDKANEISSNANNGINPEQAREGVSKAYTLNEKIREQAIKAAIAASRTGAISFPQAVEEISKNKSLQHKLAPQHGKSAVFQEDEVAEDLYMKASGTGHGRNARDDAKLALNRALNPQGDIGKIITEGDKGIGAEGQGNVKTQKDIIEGKATEAIIEGVIKLMGPAFAALLAEAKINNAKLAESIATEKRVAEALEYQNYVPGGG